jgi:hypothetical protein
MGDVGPEQEKTLAVFKEWVDKNEFNTDGRFDDYDFLRFCRARKFVIADVQLMFGNHIEWRKKNTVDTIGETWKFEEEEKVAEIYPQAYHKTDKKGRPVYIERLGTLNVPNLFKVTTEENLFR